LDRTFEEDMDEALENADLENTLSYYQNLLAESGVNPNDAAAMTQTLGVLVDSWFELKTEGDELKAQRSVIIAKQDVLELKIIELMEQADLSQIKAHRGSITCKPKSMPKVVNMTELVKWIAEDTTNRIGFLNKTVNSAAVNEMLESDGQLPPGVDTYVKQTLTKRVSRSK